MEVTLNNSLDEAIILQIVHGPDVTSLFATLENAPSPTGPGANADLVEKIKEAELAVLEANADVQQADGLSLRVQKMVAFTALTAEEQPQVLIGKQTPVDNVEANASFEAVDKLRADASQNLAKWESRVYSKIQQVKESLAITVTGAQNAFTALEEQIIALHDKHDNYAAQWHKANCLVRSKMQTIIAMLEEECRLAKPSVSKPMMSRAPDTYVETDVPLLQAHVAALQAQLTEQIAQSTCSAVKSYSCSGVDDG
jgi:hypothetical protein